MQLLLFLLKLRVSKVALLLIPLASMIGGLGGVALLALIHRVLAKSGPAERALMLTFGSLCLLTPLVGAASQVLLTWFSEKALYALRLKLCRQILYTPLRRLEEIGAPALLTTLTADIIAIADAATNLPSFITNTFIVAGCISYLAWLSWRPFVFVLGAVLFSMITVQLMQILAEREMARLRQSVGGLYNHFRSLIEGIKELKLHQARRRSFQKEELEESLELIRRHKVKTTIIFALSGGWASLLLFATLGGLAFVLPSRTAVSSEVTIGYVMATLYLLGPLGSLISNLPELTYANACIKKLNSLQLAISSERTECAAPLESSPQYNWKSLELIGVTHSYKEAVENRKFILGPLDLALFPGELIFIVGGNGSGKTTLAKLLTGLYLPESGEIRFNDQSIDDMSREFYRQHFTAIYSDFHLFKKLLGLNQPNLDREVEHYLKLLRLDGKTQVKDGILSTISVSQGQRRRLALMTAFLENRPIYLFDEWAADQDQYFREFFYKTLLPELKLKGKTVIVISHDERYYGVADRVIELECGKLKCDKRIGSPLCDSSGV